jgi:hypothetical protein
MSGREPCTYTLRELGKGWIAAWSTSAVAAKNFGLAFIRSLLQKSHGKGDLAGMPWKHPWIGRFPEVALKSPMEWVFSRQYAKQRASLTPALSGSGSKGLSHPRELRRTPSKYFSLLYKNTRYATIMSTLLLMSVAFALVAVNTFLFRRYS